jgi:putative ABC transport system substrate-binding protein
MRRREFISLFGGAAAWPVAAHAQQPAMPVIGFLNGASPTPWAHFLVAFRHGLKETGFVEGQGVRIEFRWAEGRYDRLPAMAAELVRHKVAVIVATGAAAAVLAAKNATASIPIVFTTGGDPVKIGLVASLNRPGGNVTGVVLLTSMMDAKRLGLLREMVPSATLIAVLTNPRNAYTQYQVESLREGARSVGQNITILKASTDAEITSAVSSLKAIGAQALLVAADAFFNARREFLVALTTRNGVPAMYEFREFAAAGGLMSYGTHLPDGYHQAGIYTGRILKGEKPADLPVYQLSTFEFVINLNAAQALGLEVPANLSARADKVIE